MSELKPCPFCGENKLLYSGGCGFRYDDDDNQIRLFRVHCRTCKGRTGLFESLDEAVEAWNRRTNSTTIQPSALGTNLAEVGTDLISRQSAVDELVKMLSDCFYADEEVLDAVETTLKELPSAQPEIIRCKDCDWWTKQEDSPQGRCALLQMYPTGGWFCGNARRREETA